MISPVPKKTVSSAFKETDKSVTGEERFAEWSSFQGIVTKTSVYKYTAVRIKNNYTS